MSVHGKVEFGFDPLEIVPAKATKDVGLVPAASDVADDSNWIVPIPVLNVSLTTAHCEQPPID